uniref:DNA helicase Pif1-like protein n=1 Tax=Tanacetum cinerariifolium TaxID=118510 RepID=A0A6L2K6X9_TANCI|nr:DNA helicase Pif1-like protein [Tanacetum cinerariifolium]
MLIEFVIQNQFFSYTLKEFAQILDIPCEGACVFTDKWSPDELAYGVPMDGPFQTNPPSPDDIILYIRNDREGLDYGTRRGRHSTSSSFAFDQPSSSHLSDDDDGNDEGTSRASTPSPTRFVNSLTNEVPQIFHNPPNIDPDMEPFYTRKTKIINRQVQLRDEHHGGLRSIGKGLKNLWRNMKKN